ncbi:MAG: hypothetical protein ACK47B_07265 [Armatimonadota bacterium]
MNRTTFKFTLEFQSEDPHSDHARLVELLSRVPGVEAVATVEEITEGCPVARLAVDTHFQDSQQAWSLYNRLTRQIHTCAGVYLWKRECRLAEMHASEEALRES